MVEDGNGHGLVVDLAGEIAPAPTSAPGSVALSAFTGQIDAVYAGVVQLGDRGWIALCVREHFRFIAGSFQAAGNAHAQYAFLIVIEHNVFADRLQRGDAVDAAKIGSAAEDKASVLLQNDLTLAANPVGINFEFALLGTTLCERDRLVTNVAHLRCVFRLDSCRVVPEIETVDVPIVEPQADVMWMVDALARTRIQRISSRNESALGVTQRIQNGLSKFFGPDIRGEWLSVNEHLDAALSLIGNDADSWCRRVLLGTHIKRQNQKCDYCCSSSATKSEHCSIRLRNHASQALTGSTAAKVYITVSEVPVVASRESLPQKQSISMRLMCSRPPVPHNSIKLNDILSETLRKSPGGLQRQHLRPGREAVRDWPVQFPSTERTEQYSVGAADSRDFARDENQTLSSLRFQIQRWLALRLRAQRHY